MSAERPKSQTRPAPKEIALTEEQKVRIIRYCLSYSKGFLEDEGEWFCDPDTNAEPDWRDVGHTCELFTDKVRAHITKLIREGTL